MTSCWNTEQELNNVTAVSLCPSTILTASTCRLAKAITCLKGVGSSIEREGEHREREEEEEINQTIQRGTSRKTADSSRVCVRACKVGWAVPVDSGVFCCFEVSSI